MRKILLLLIVFSLGIFSVLRCQYYNRDAPTDSSFSEKLKNVIDGLIDDGVALKNYIQKKTSKKDGSPLPENGDDPAVSVEKIEIDPEESPLDTGMNAEGI